MGRRKYKVKKQPTPEVDNATTESPQRDVGEYEQILQGYINFHGTDEQKLLFGNGILAKYGTDDESALRSALSHFPQLPQEESDWVKHLSTLAPHEQSNSDRDGEARVDPTDTAQNGSNDKDSAIVVASSDLQTAVASTPITESATTAQPKVAAAGSWLNPFNLVKAVISFAFGSAEEVDVRAEAIMANNPGAFAGLQDALKADQVSARFIAEAYEGDNEVGVLGNDTSHTTDA